MTVSNTSHYKPVEEGPGCTGRIEEEGPRSRSRALGMQPGRWHGWL
jgi:hypothetical protein